MGSSNKAPHKSHPVPVTPSSCIPFSSKHCCHPFAKSLSLLFPLPSCADLNLWLIFLWSHKPRVSFGLNRIQRGKGNVPGNSQERHPDPHCQLSEITGTVFPHLVIIIKLLNSHGVTGKPAQGTALLLQ